MENKNTSSSNNNTLIFEKTIKHAQQYKIDKKKLIEFYQIKKKDKYKYNIIQKKIFFGRENTINKIDKKKKYSEYLIFRQLLQKEYDIEDIKYELENAKEIVNYSKNIREEFYRYFKLRKDEINTISQQNLEIINNNIGDFNDDMNNLFIDDFLKKCSLLKKKEKFNEEIEKKSKFQIYSDLEKESDEYNAEFVNLNKLNLQYYEQKQKILKVYNREYELVNFINKVKDGLIKTTPDTLNTKVKDKFSSEIIDALFDNRDLVYYYPIDSFFNKYKMTFFKIKDEERDLYEHIYSILSKNNYMNFLSFLYSKNSLFKFIYNKFSDKDTTKENLTLEGMVNMNNLNNENKHLKEIIDIPSGYLIDSNNIHNVEQIINKKKEVYEMIDGSYIFINCGYINKILSHDDIREFFNFENGNNMSLENIDLTFGQCLIKSTQIDLNHLLIIDKNNRLKILNFKETFIDANMEYINVYKINKINLQRRLEPSLITLLYNKKNNNINVSDLDSSSNDFNYYIIEDKTENEVKCYLIKIEEKFTEKFENLLIKNFNLSELDKIKESEIEENEESEENEDNEDNEQNTIESKIIKEKIIENKKTETEENKTSEEKSNTNDTILEIGKGIRKVTKVPSLNLNKTNESASILNSSNLSSVSETGINKLIKEKNFTNMNNYETRSKKYEFEINNELYTLQITSDELKYSTSNQKSGKYLLKSLSYSKPQYNESKSCYQMDIYSGKKNIFKIENSDKSKLDDLYNELSQLTNL